MSLAFYFCENLASVQWLFIAMSKLSLVITGLVLAVLVAVLRLGIGIPALRNAHGASSGIETPRLGDLTYDIRKLNTPRVDGLALRALAGLAMTPILGPVIMRLLINDNHIEAIRELAMQVTSTPSTAHWSPSIAGQDRG